MIIGEEKRKFDSLDEEVKYTIDKKSKSLKINEIKKYLPLEITSTKCFRKI